MGLIHDLLRMLERLQVAPRPATVAIGDFSVNFSATSTVVAQGQLARLRVVASAALLVTASAATFIALARFSLASCFAVISFT